jgi:hypothetical protein
MDYKTFKRQMAQQDPANKHMSDSDMRAKYEEHLNSNQNSETGKSEHKATSSGAPSPITGFSSGLSDVTITDIDMPFGAMVKFMVKWSLAAIPAFTILVVIFSIVFAVFGGLLVGLSQGF